MSRETHKTSTTIPEDWYKALQEVAEKEKLSISAYLSRMIMQNEEISKLYKKSLVNKNTDESNNDLESKRTILTIEPETAQILHQKASALGMTDTAYVRNLIHTKDFKIYRVQTEDIDLLISEVHKAIGSLSSSVSLIKKYGKGEVYAADIRKILSDSDEIKAILRKIVANLYGTRRTAQQKLVNQYKKLY